MITYVFINKTASTILEIMSKSAHITVSTFKLLVEPIQRESYSLMRGLEDRITSEESLIWN